MLTCYVDESGDEQPLRTELDPPVLVIAGIVVSHETAPRLLWDYLELKKAFNPQATKSMKLSDLIKFEIKGSDLRSAVRKSSRRERRRATGFLDSVLDILERNSAAVVGEVMVKSDSRGLPRYMYPQAISRLADQFETQLRAAGTQGLMVLDSRTKNKNVPSVHSITTRRFRSQGGHYPHFVDSPVFGHSDSHVVLQVVDILASALLFPMACAAYCDDLTENVHVHSAYEVLRERFGDRIRGLEQRYLDANGRRTGGVCVRDDRNRRPTLNLLRPASACQPKLEGQPALLSLRDAQHSAD
ncbi:DUF3800 domain-containing protein [Salana multivorans]